PGGNAAARRRPRQPGGTGAGRLRRAFPRPRGLDRQIDRRPVRPDAAQRRRRRVHEGRAARARAHRHREGRPLAAAAGRAVGPGRHRPRRGRRTMGRAGRPGNEGPRGALQPAEAPRRRRRSGGPPMTATLAPAPPPGAPKAGLAPRAPPLRLERRHWLAALAVLFAFFAPYQTLVQTVITDDAVRKGVDVDSYDMTWVQVGYTVGLLYGAFTGLWLAPRIGARYTIALGMLGFALGALMTGSAVGLVSLALGRCVDGFGKMMVVALCRTTLYKQFDHLLLVGIGFYGIFAYATRNATPLVMAELDVYLSWRWMYWWHVPIALVGMALVWRYFR